MSRCQDAVQLFRQGFSCSQAVVASLCEPLGLEKDKALKIAQAFGGGMASMGRTCGAVTGAMMAIGLKYGRTRPEDEESKARTYRLVHEFWQRFLDLHGSTDCRELIGIDLSTAEGHKKGEERGVFATLCPGFVSDAVAILEQIL